MGGAIGEARAVAEAGAETARTQGLQGYVGAFLRTQAAIDAFKLGDWEAADAAAAGLVAQPLALTTRVAIDAVRGRLALEYGHLESARSILQSAWGSSTGASYREYVPAIASGLAELELAGGDGEAAWERVQAGLERLGDAADGLAAPELYATGGRVTSALRDPGERGSRLLDGLDRLLAQQPYRLPEADAYRAQLEAELAPEPDWAAVAERWSVLAMPRHEAYARLREAEIAMVGRDREAAASALARAQALVGELGAVSLGAEIDALARSARLTPTPKAKPIARAEESPFGLSARELDVLSLLAEGLTNRQIAERLFISSRTAGVHVAHILQKMSVRNRVEAASTAQRLGLVTSQHNER
jgi:DNA-binding NarL/FixJ family response regulator